MSANAVVLTWAFQYIFVGEGSISSWVKEVYLRRRGKHIINDSSIVNFFRHRVFIVITLLVIRLLVIILFAIFVHKMRLELWRISLLYSE